MFILLIGFLTHLKSFWVTSLLLIAPGARDNPSLCLVGPVWLLVLVAPWRPLIAPTGIIPVEFMHFPGFNGVYSLVNTELCVYIIPLSRFKATFF